MSDCIYIKQDLIAFKLCHVLLFRKTKHQQDRKTYYTLDGLLLSSFEVAGHCDVLYLVLRVTVDGSKA